MALKKQLQELANKEMDRKDFLKYSGGVLLAVVGVTGLVRILVGQKNIGFEDEKVAKAATNGYGSSFYGR